MKKKIVKIAVVSYIMEEEDAASPLMQYDSMLVQVDTSPKFGNKDYYVNICKAVCNLIHNNLMLEYPGSKIFSRFVDYEVFRISDMIYMSDLQEDGYLDMIKK